MSTINFLTAQARMGLMRPSSYGDAVNHFLAARTRRGRCAHLCMEMSTINFLTAQARMGLMRPNPYVQLCPDTGLWQIGLVRHDDGNPSDEFCCALTITGVDSCGNVHFPPRSKAFGRALLKVDENLIIKIVIPSNG